MSPQRHIIEVMKKTQITLPQLQNETQTAREYREMVQSVPDLGYYPEYNSCQHKESDDACPQKPPQEEIVIRHGDDEISVLILKSKKNYVKVGI